MVSASALGAVFITSVLGSLHCVGMCGGFVALSSCGHGENSCAAGKVCGKRSHALTSQLAYHAGRLGIYLTLGAVAGALGALVNRSQPVLGVQQLAGVLAGVVIVFWGLAQFGGPKFLSRLGLHVPLLAKIVQELYRLSGNLTGVRRGLTFGLLSGILPCGWLYAFVLAAASAGSSLGGIAVMFAFWLGTVPALLALGVSLQRIDQRWLKRVPRLSAVALVFLGVMCVMGKLQIPLPLIGSAHPGHSCHEAMP